MTSITGEHGEQGLPSTIFDKIGYGTIAGWVLALLIALGAYGTRLGILESRTDPRVDRLMGQREDDKQRIESLERDRNEILRLLAGIAAYQAQQKDTMAEIQKDVKDLRRDVTGRMR